MTVYVLGAGASVHAGYPLASDMGKKLLSWMKKPVDDQNAYAARYPRVADFLEKEFAAVNNAENIEVLVASIRSRIRQLEAGTQEQRESRAKIASAYGVLQNAVREWFGQIQQDAAISTAYREFAEHVVADGETIITFNYDVSLERELRRAGKFEIGDGYGFPMEGLPMGSRTRVLKLHGSTSWLALLFGGSTGFRSFTPGNTLCSPVIGSNDLSFLGYANDVVDTRFRDGGAALPVMIFPAPLKEFYFDVNTGVEYRGFWDRLWRQAGDALMAASNVVICGYSLQDIDERARNLLLEAAPQASEVLVAAGSDADTQRIVRKYLDAGYSATRAANELRFEDWVAAASSSVVAIR